jgi:signal transduction histidine kinase/Tfp pilus assembly protein PilF
MIKHLVCFVLLFFLNFNLFSQSENYKERVESYITNYRKELSAKSEKAISTAQELLELTTSKNDSFNIVRARNCMAAYYMTFGEFGEAKKNYLKIIEIVDAGFELPALNLGRIYNDMGALYVNLNNKKMAMKSFLKAYKIRDSIQDPKLSSTLNNVATLYSIMGDVDKSLEFLFKTLKVREENKDSIGVANVLNNISLNYIRQEKYDLSIQTCSEALTYIPYEYVNHEIIGNLFGNIGSAYSFKKEYKKALINYQKQYENGIENKNFKLVASSLYEIGECYLKNKNFSKSEDYFLNCLTLCKETGYSKIEEKLYFSLSNMFKEKKDYKSSLEFLEKYYEYKDSLNSAESQSSAEALKSKFEALISKQEKEILQKENKLKDIEIQKVNAQRNMWISSVLLLLIIAILFILLFIYRTKTNKILVELNATKDKLFLLVAHDLKNPLSAFRSITQNLSENFDSFDRKDISMFLNKLNKSSHKLVGLLQNLQEWALNETGKIPFKRSPIDIKNLLDEIIDLLLLNAENKNIVLSNEIAEDSYIVADKNMLKTIIRNLMSNAIKFSVPGKNIRIHSSNENKDFIINITDEGIGINQSDQKRLFSVSEDVSNIGNSKEKGTGLGLMLCKELVNRHGGHIWVESELGKGSTFSFSIPQE